MSSTDFMVSSIEDSLLFLKTSGDDSIKIWLVARRRRMRAVKCIRLSTVCFVSQKLITESYRIRAVFFGNFIDAESFRMFT
jgi:hypothetical protein